MVQFRGISTIFLLSVVSIAWTRPPARRVPKVDTFDGQIDYLEEFGYLPRGRRLQHPTISEPDVFSAIKRFQRKAAIPQTGKLDGLTLKMMRSPRCGVVDENSKTRKTRYVHLNKGWGHKDLTYRIVQYPSATLTKLTNKEVDDTIARAFKVWSDASQLTFKVLPTGTVDIVIQFAAGSHGDNSAFDGASGVLAHAYQPYTKPGGTVNKLHGDAHFDDAETWTIKTYSGINLFQVAVHEFGHSLGIGHSNEKNAIMYAFYRGYVPNMKLHDDDVKAIQALYGALVPTQAPTDAPVTTDAPATVGPTSQPGDCTIDFDKWDSVRRRGFKKYSNINTLKGCKDICVKSDTCWAFTFKNVNRNVPKCFVFELQLVAAKHFDFFFKVPDADGSSTYKKMESQKHRGGLRSGQLTQAECQEVCDVDEECIGYTYRKVTRSKQKWWCRIHTIPATENRRLTHYVKTTTCN